MRLQEEPERHVWQAEVGTVAQPWLGDHQIHDVAVLPGPPTARWRWRRLARCLAKPSEARDIRFEQALLLDGANHGRCRRVADITGNRRT